MLYEVAPGYRFIGGLIVGIAWVILAPELAESARIALERQSLYYFLRAAALGFSLLFGSHAVVSLITVRITDKDASCIYLFGRKSIRLNSTAAVRCKNSSVFVENDNARILVSLFPNAKMSSLLLAIIRSSTSNGVAHEPEQKKIDGVGHD
jgi:hypothetical protein